MFEKIKDLVNSSVTEFVGENRWHIFLVWATFLMLLFTIGYLSYFDYFHEEMPYKLQIAIDPTIYDKAKGIEDAEARTAFIKEIAKLGEEVREDSKKKSETALQMFNVIVGALISFLTVLYTKFFDRNNNLRASNNASQKQSSTNQP
jgi:hypothetical protein